MRVTCSLPMSPLDSSDELHQRVERYYDAVPRARSAVEEVGPFTLFVATHGWPYYARPRLGGSGAFTVDDVRAVLDRQAELGVPRSIEWMHDVTPELLDVARDAGMTVAVCPLLVLDGEPRGDAPNARMLAADDIDTATLSRAAVWVGFGNPGTATGPPGLPERDAAAAERPAPLDPATVDGIRSGRRGHAAAYDPDAPELGPVGGGSFTAVDDVAELTGIAVLPTYRRRGLAAQLTKVMADAARAHGVTTVFCSAQNDDVARVYEGISFRRVATACIAEVPADR